MPINLADLNPQQEVAAVYLGYYDRAADPFGFDFWSQDAYPALLNEVQSEPEFSGATLVEQEEEVLARIAQDFARQPETKAEYPFFQTPSAATATAFLNQVYQNLFDRPIDTGAGSGAEFWTPLLLDAVNNPSTADFSVGEIIIEIIKGAQEPDKSIVENKIEASLDWTENAAANGIGTTATNFVVQDVATGEFNIVDQEAYDAARDVIDGVDETPESVDAAKQETQDFIVAYNTPEPTTLVLGDADLVPGGVYEADTVILNLDQEPPTMTVNAGLVIIKAQNESSPSPFIVDTSNWNVDEITVEDSEVDVVVQDIQGTDLNVEDDSDNPNGTTTFDFDSQALQGDTEIDLGINEVFGSVVIQNDGPDLSEGLETVNLVINDPDNIESEMDSLQVQGLETLNVIGGNEGNAFTITGPLDAGIMRVDGSGAVADLNLNMSDSTEAITAIGGSGDDTYDMGNTLGSSSDQDILIGNEGDDTLVATFTTPGNRKPISEGFEKFVLHFESNAQLDLDDVDDLETIEIASVADDTGVEIQDADSTVTDLLITGETGGPGGNNDWEFGYKDIVDDESDQDNLTVTWQNNTGETQFIDEFYIDRAEDVTFIFDGQQEMVIDDGFDLGFDVNDGDDEEVTENLVIRNANDGDGTIDTDGGMDESDRLETLTIETTDAGDLFLDADEDKDFDDFIDDAGELEEISITASVNGDIYVGNIGEDEEAVELRNINILSAGADIFVGRISGDDEGNNDGASVSEVNITADDDAFICIDEIEVEDIGAMTIVTEDDSVVQFGSPSDDGIDMDNQGGSLVVSGDGTLAPLNFENEAFATMDFTGLVENGVCVDWRDADFGSTVEGTDQDDEFFAGDGDDIINGNDGDDVIVGRDGDDVLNGGDDDDYLFGGNGNDTLDGGAGDDFIAGGLNGPSNPFGDILTGGSGSDIFYFAERTNDPLGDTGKSTNIGAGGLPAQDVITDFTPAGDTIVIDTLEGGFGPEFDTGGYDGEDLECDSEGPLVPDVADIDGLLDDYQIAVFDGVQSGVGGVDLSLIGTLGAPVLAVLRVGDYNDDGSFNFNGDGEDLQLLLDRDQDFGFPAELGLNGGAAFSAAEYEIGLLGAADKLGSFDTSDILFV